MTSVYECARWVVDNAAEVRINTSKLQEFVERHADTKPIGSSAAAGGDADAPQAFLGWRECPFHFVESHPGELQALYVLVLDALNFCFWPTDPTHTHTTHGNANNNNSFEYEHLARGLRRVATERPHDLTPHRLASITEAQLSEWLGVGVGERGMLYLCLMDERVRLVRQLGTALLEGFGGSAVNMVRRADRSAVELVRLITAHLPGFRDEAVYRGHQVVFYKRAQILVADLWGAFGTAECDGLCDFHDIDQLTLFADYRVPQLFRELGVLEYSDDLDQCIASRSPIHPDSPREVEIRAAAIVACRMVRDGLNGGTSRGGKSHKWMDIQVDWLLWQLGERMRDTMRPHHRTLTVFY
ncbi:unnamed protein product [Vitrella brassicaformis CCMP3155]|uniref:Queuosine 5'-phosphate N-glycosylase/hydrolase n=1 Tax=Vitrella brassicaformis (strain CCMP3155) TaxID=1169540 RepID=A0A0G4FB77_VITBC|nr:unnamed protein product [Vitrella brassicaformis CCMP3155]|eukprot:CEM09888.1 unnamed protein product [Vitrella brassicaformis CCMP3155]